MHTTSQQAINQPTNQPTNQSTNQPTNQAIAVLAFAKSIV
jgi:hypothetical protein